MRRAGTTPTCCPRARAGSGGRGLIPVTGMGHRLAEPALDGRTKLHAIVGNLAQDAPNDPIGGLQPGGGWRIVVPHHFDPYVDRPQKLVCQQLGRLTLQLGATLTLSRPPSDPALAGVSGRQFMAAVAEPVEPTRSRSEPSVTYSPLRLGG